MLNENQISFLPERICQRLASVNEEYLEEIGAVLKKIGELRPKDVHQLQRMYNYGANLERVIDKLAQTSGKNIQEIYDIFDIVAKENYNYARPFYEAQGKSFIPYEENESLQRYVKSLAEQTVGEYKNLTQHTAFAVFSEDGKSIAPLFEANKNKLATSLSDTYTKVVDYAVTKVQLGTESYSKAVKDICRAMAASGIKTVEYATGYKRRLDSAVRQNVLWGVKECNQNTADLIGEDFGADGYEISYHSNPRPKHADMAGKTYAKGEARTVKGVYYPSFEKEAKPLLEEFGCLHFKFSVLLGISRPAYSKEELARLKAEGARTFEFEGKKYTQYEAKQLQGKLENAIVRQKELANMAKAAGDEVLRREVQGHINLLSSKYHKLCQASGLPTRAERMKVGGFRKVKTIGELKGPIAWISDSQNPTKAFKDYLAKLSGGNYALERRHRFLLDKIPKAGTWARIKNHQASLEDLAALTAFTGDEFALFSAKGHKIIFHGKRIRWNLPNDAFEEICAKKMVWEGHSHPHPGDLMPSDADRKTLKLLTWQKRSTIIDVEGSTKTFTALYADVINDMFGGG